MKRIADFEQQHASLLAQLPKKMQGLVKARQHEAASVAGKDGGWVKYCHLARTHELLQSDENGSAKHCLLIYRVGEMDFSAANT